MDYRKILRNLPLWRGRSLRLQPFLAGGTNTKFLVVVGKEKFVARFQAEAQRRFLRLRRTTEIANTNVAHRLGLGPAVVAHYPRYGLLIVRYLEGKPLRKYHLRRPSTLQDVVRLLKRLHHGPRFRGRFSILESIGYFWRLAERDGKRLLGRTALIQRKFSTCRSAMRRRRARLTPCHIDLMPINFIRHGRKLKLIDWEYASMGDPLFDLAFLSAVGRLRVADDAILLHRYFGTVSSQLGREFRALKALVYLREALWGLTQLGRSNLPFNYRGYINQNTRWFLAAPVDSTGWPGKVLGLRS